MMRKRSLIGLVWACWCLLVPLQAAEVSRVVVHEYTARVDDMAETVKIYGQVLAHADFEVQLREVVEKVPIFTIQYDGYHYKKGPENEPSYVEARAQCVTEHLVHAWTLMDHGAVLEIGEDDWNTQRSTSKPAPHKNLCIYVRSPVHGSKPLRVLTLYPEDVAGYPWISSTKSLGEYLIELMQAHYLLFWKNSGDISKFEALRLDKTREGKIFKEIALRALEVARLKEVPSYDGEILKDALARLALSQQERLYRLATSPPMDWESSAKD